MDDSARQVAEIVGPRIRRIRRTQEMSQETLGYLAEVDFHGPISRIEHGERLPRIDTLIKLAAGIGVSPCSLIDGLLWEVRGTRPGRFIFREGGGVDE